MEIESYTLDFLSFLSPQNKPTQQKANLDQIKPQEAKPRDKRRKPDPNETPGTNPPTW